MARSAREIWFRLRQEAANLRLYAMPPRLPAGFKAGTLALPDGAAVAARLRESSFAADVERVADEILEHRFPLLGSTVQTGAQIEWRKDYVHGQSTETAYFRRIPYLDFAHAGDHKIVWELSRHQHLVLLAQAWLLRGKRAYVDEIERELESWIEQNPFQRGIHWASALEVGFRALSWMWIWHLAGSAMRDQTRQRLLTGIYQHGRHLERNLSVYFSPNTHLLGEAVALHALGTLFPALPGAKEWRRVGRKTVLEQMEFQVQEDGSHFEHSTYYHVYALDMFLLHHLLEAAPYTRQLTLMADYLNALMGPARRLASVGDDDGGRLFHPYGARDEFGRATLATSAVALGGAWRREDEDLAPQAAWWLGPSAFAANTALAGEHRSRIFRACGMAVMTSEAHVVVDAGGFGYGGAGHSHSDTLSITARAGNADVLIDPGTFTYVSDLQWRAWFRGSAAHNTIRVDGRDQAQATGPFRWEGKPAVRILDWSTAANFDYLDAICESEVRHRRRVAFLKPDLVLVLDEVAGPEGEHVVESFWHLGEAGMCARMVFPGMDRPEMSEGGEHGWRSPVFGVRTTAPVIRVMRTSRLPAMFAAAIDLATEPRGGALELETDESGHQLVWSGPQTIVARYSQQGPPLIGSPTA